VADALGSEPTSPLVIEGFDSTDDKVVVGAGNTLSAFDSDGNKLWATVMEGGDIAKAGAVMVDQPEERVIFAAGNTLSKVDAAEGTIIWSSVISKTPLGSPSIGDPNLVGDPNILVGDEDGVLYSVDPATGAVLSQFVAGGAFVGSPAIGDPNVLPWVFVGDSKGDIYAFDQTDEFPPPPIWQAALGDPIGGPTVLANGVVYEGPDS
jgi:outer membrane protein assembly factor BamB